jgi:UDP-N-acetyl-D-mannosaminuronic acid dehydrogenase
VSYDVCVVGGCGRVGLPLGMCFAERGKRTVLLDINEEAVRQVSAGQMPFLEEGADVLLPRLLSEGGITATTDDSVISHSDSIIMVLGTPVDDHLNPSYSDLIRVVRMLVPQLHDGQLLVLRSTLFPGTSERVQSVIRETGKDVDVAFCPERIAEGHALAEISSLPQIISGFTPRGLGRARELFAVLTDDIVELSPLEAEISKLFTNVWRYIRFAIANQFYSIANDNGLDYYKLHEAITHNYPRAKDLPAAGFAAGPCLLKDTLQLAAFSHHSFFLGHAAMLVNEGQPDYVVKCLKDKYPLSTMTVGILGMAFKGNSDDGRESLAYRLRKLLEIECKQVLITDPYVQDSRIAAIDEVIEQADILILGAPHSAYRDLDLSGKDVIDVWNFFGNGGIV